MCTQCRQPFFTTPVYLMGAPYCQTCGYGQSQGTYAPQFRPQMNANFPVPAVQPASESTLPKVWECPACNYAYNVVRDDKTCKRCHGLRPGAVQPDASSYRAAAPTKSVSRPQPSSQAVWTCSACSHSLCLPDDQFCPQCGVPREGVLSSTWSCPQCNETNYAKNEYCNRCGGQRAKGVEVKVVLQGKAWLCLCGAANPMMLSNCQVCGQFNTAIDKLKEAFDLK